MSNLDRRLPARFETADFMNIGQPLKDLTHKAQLTLESAEPSEATKELKMVISSLEELYDATGKMTLALIKVLADVEEGC